VKTLYPPTSDAEIAVFETDEKVTQPYTVTLPAGGDGPTLGQQVWFLGYPRTGTKILLGSHFSNGDYPFTKRGLMSAIDATNINATVLYVDGFNNPGFSGAQSFTGVSTHTNTKFWESFRATSQTARK
jgi:hypothetical protein